MQYFYPIYFHRWNSIFFQFFHFECWKILRVDFDIRTSHNYIYVFHVTFLLIVSSNYSPKPHVYDSSPGNWSYSHKNSANTVDCLGTGWGSEASDSWLVIMCWVNTLKPRQHYHHFTDDVSNAFSWIKSFEFQKERPPRGQLWMEQYLVSLKYWPIYYTIWADPNYT